MDNTLRFTLESVQKSNCFIMLAAHLDVTIQSEYITKYNDTQLGTFELLDRRRPYFEGLSQRHPRTKAIKTLHHLASFNRIHAQCLNLSTVPEKMSALGPGLLCGVEERVDPGVDQGDGGSTSRSSLRSICLEARDSAETRALAPPGLRIPNTLLPSGNSTKVYRETTPPQAPAVWLTKPAACQSPEKMTKIKYVRARIRPWNACMGPEKVWVGKYAPPNRPTRYDREELACRSLGDAITWSFIVRMLEARTGYFVAGIAGLILFLPNAEPEPRVRFRELLNLSLNLAFGVQRIRFGV
ncbi:hypothetical protein K438DRAFT_1751243 [Mycena galopus ATCC 62051]|nr:hypothetical protein K438DRAFT_1751243 [Mycena galopus ATCC 62051]